MRFFVNFNTYFWEKQVIYTAIPFERELLNFSERRKSPQKRTQASSPPLDLANITPPTPDSRSTKSVFPEQDISHLNVLNFQVTGRDFTTVLWSFFYLGHSFVEQIFYPCIKPFVRKA